MQPEWIVTAEESGIKLLTYLKGKLGDVYSTKHIKRAIESNCCSVNLITERFSTVQLGAGDRVALNISPPTKHSINSFFDKTRILYEDEALLIYNKPDGITSDDPEFIKALHGYCPTLILIHRLDKDTSGALILSKNPAIQAKLIELFKKHLVKKGYLALVDGVPKKLRGVIDNYLSEKHRQQGQVTWSKVEADADKALRAVTEWKCIKSGAEASLIECMPKTGRTHQIRIHLNDMGHPILGDFQYGKKFRCGYRPARHLLHAYTLNFPHPCTQKSVQICAPLPDDFKSAIKICIGATPYDQE